jgi:hypothetical protein
VEENVINKTVATSQLLDLKKARCCSARPTLRVASIQKQSGQHRSFFGLAFPCLFFVCPIMAVGDPTYFIVVCGVIGMIWAASQFYVITTTRSA